MRNYGNPCRITHLGGGITAPPTTNLENDMTIIKRTVPQAVFDTPSALKAARLGHEGACRELAATHVHLLDSGNPNHPINDGIFGYETKAFLVRQY